jgi:HD-GYP domain-containing protein (c-di-GMP phosphodiesterase class II)
MLEIKLPTSQVGKGMYVARLDRPWTETPFPFQGFKIDQDIQIRKLREYCQHVYIDADKGVVPTITEMGGPAPLPPGVAPVPLPRPQVIYQHESQLNDEIQVAKEVRTAVARAVDEVFSTAASGQRPDLETISGTVSDMERSMLRNPDAFLLLNKMRRQDSYTYSHSIHCGAYAIAFGRQLGLPPAQIHELALGAMLFDLGKIKLPKGLLEKRGDLVATEFAVIKMHVKHSLDLLQDCPGISPQTIAMIATHHERFDGSGYPKGIRGGEIPLFGRMAGIVDFFDAVTSVRPHAPNTSPHEAIKSLYRYRNTLFQDELIEQFIQTLGVYPVGTLVELSNGEVGIIVGQNRARRLRPRVLVVLDSDKTELTTPPVRDLMLEEEDAEQPLYIQKCLEPGTYNVHPDDYYL